MSRSAVGRHIDWRVASLLTVILLLFLSIAITHSSVFASYTRDVVNEETYCAAQYSAPEKHEETNFQSFWYRSFNDPAIAWNFYYSLLTAFLVIFAAGTIFVALRSIAVQRSEAKRLFIADQRAWLQIDVAFAANPFKETASGQVIMYCDIKITNVGKTPAFDVGDPGILSYRHEIDVDQKVFDMMKQLPRRKSWNFPFITERDKLRNAVCDSAFFPPSTNIFPGDCIVHKNKYAYISKNDAESTWKMDPFSAIYIYFSVPYESSFEPNKWYATTIVSSVHAMIFGTFGIPRNEDEIASVARLREKAKDTPILAEMMNEPHLARVDNLCVIT